MRRLQLALAALLVAATAVFAAGAIAERSQPDTHAESATREAGAHREVGEASERPPAGEQAGAADAVFGVDAESVPLIALAAIGGLGLAAVAAGSPGRRTGVLLAIAAITLAWTALDVREAAHQLDESRTGIAVAAILAAVLHLAAAILAGALAARTRHARAGSTGRSGPMPA
jgi:hypothetical protein